MKRILGIVLVLLVVGLGVTLWWLTGSIDTLVARAIRTYGSQVLGTEVRVASVALELRSGTGTIRGLRVANPEGFSNADALAFEELQVGIVPGSVLESPLVVSKIRLIDPRVRLEVDAQGRTNLQVLQGNAQSYAPQDEPASAPEPEGGEPTRIRIDEIVLEKGQLVSDLRAVGEEEREASLPSFRLTDLGGAAGAEPGVLAKQVAQQLTGQLARRAARERIGSAVRERIDEALEGRPEGEAVQDLLRRLGGSGDAN